MTQEMVMRHTRQAIFGFCYLLSNVSSKRSNISSNCSLNVIALGLAVRTPCYRWWIHEQAYYYGNNTAADDGPPYLSFYEKGISGHGGTDGHSYVCFHRSSQPPVFAPEFSCYHTVRLSTNSIGVPRRAYLQRLIFVSDPS